MGEKDLATQLVEFALGTRYEDIPPEALDYTKRLTLKTVSGMLAGSAKPSGRKMAGLIRNQQLPGEVSIMGSGFKSSLWQAVLLHTFFAHASELEDDRFNGGISYDITVIPLLFPLAEKFALAGKSLLESLVLGLELTARTVLFDTKYLGLGQIPGAVGPTLAAARALGLGAKEAAAAIGLALPCTPSTVLNFGTDGHYLESALISLQAVIAAEMAKVGLAGNPDIGSFLTSFLGKERFIPEKIVEGLGKKWMLSEIWIKKYPCCFLQHRQIDSLIELKKEHNLSYGEVKEIEVHASLAEKLCDRPEPKNEGDVQFSFQHSLSVALMEGDVSLQHISAEAVNDPKLKEARGKVKIIYYPDWTKEFNKAPARIVVKTHDGREFAREKTVPRGHPLEPLTDEQLLGLYAKFTGGILSAKDISRSADMILNLERLRTVQELIDILA